MSQIIKLIGSKGVVNSNDVENIVKENNIRVSAVSFMSKITTNGDCDGSAAVIPGLLLSFLIIIGIGQPLFWDADHQDCHPDDEHIDITVGDKTYTNEHRGTALGFFGFGGNSMNMIPGEWMWCCFNLNGFALLAFVS